MPNLRQTTSFEEWLRRNIKMCDKKAANDFNKPLSIFGTNMEATTMAINST